MNNADITLTRRGIIRCLAVVLVAVGVVSCASACGDDTSAPPNGVLAAESAASSSSSHVRVQTSTAAANSALAKSFARLKVSSELGLALAPVGGGDVVVLGDQTPRVAWSTIKVPLALAAQRKNGRGDQIEPAIVESDNDAALALRRSLGTPEQGRRQVTAVLRDAGDITTEAVEIIDDDETFGLTVWPLTAAATFAGNLPCLSDSDYILSLMGRVAPIQQWGIETMKAPRAVAVKGGWGPADGGGEEVRQLGVITHRDGTRTAVAVSTHADSMDDGVADLNRVAAWLSRHLSRLPRGRC